ncbi:hypothetical protein FS749_001929 [Ceratobasidium sp. UAMH 11750]|nr:hypothetical protein FS749_001929 [Ceratobasidium sp. UAMH 11750]
MVCGCLTCFHPRFLRIQVLSNCQRHVKLCQKRSTKVLSPGDEDAAPDSAAGPSGTTSSSFITYPDSNTTEEPVRRPNEIPIRPKIAAHASGNGSSLLGARPAALERPASVASSSVVEGEGAGSEASAVPVVPSSSYSYSSGPGFASTSGSGSGFGYDEAHAFEPPQTIYEEPSSEYASESPYEPAGSGFDAARASSYDTPRAGSAYEPSTSGYAGPGYDSLGSGYGASGSAYGPSAGVVGRGLSIGCDGIWIRRLLPSEPVARPSQSITCAHPTAPEPITRSRELSIGIRHTFHAGHAHGPPNPSHARRLDVSFIHHARSGHVRLALHALDREPRDGPSLETCVGLDGAQDDVARYQLARRARVYDRACTIAPPDDRPV